MKIPFITISISSVMMALFVLLGSAPETLVWLADHNDQTWRSISAHFVHSDTEHLLWNLAAFLILGSIIEQYSKRDLLIALLVGILVVNSYLYTLYDLNAYVGFSGVLNTLLIITLFNLSQQPHYRDAAIWVLLMSMAKIIYELYSEQSVFSSISWAAVPEAHLAGWVGGILIVITKTINYFGKNKFQRYKSVVNV